MIYQHLLQKSDKGETPLHFAVRIGRKDMVKLLIAHGADTSLPGRDGLSAVGIAKKAGFTTIADTIRDSIELKKFLEKHSLEKLLKPFLEEELYLYLLPDIPDSTLSKFVPNDAERAKLLELAREATKGAAEGEERVRLPPFSTSFVIAHAACSRRRASVSISRRWTRCASARATCASPSVNLSCARARRQLPSLMSAFSCSFST